MQHTALCRVKHTRKSRDTLPLKNQKQLLELLAHTEHLFKKHEILPITFLMENMKVKLIQGAAQNILSTSSDHIWVKKICGTRTAT